MVISTVLSHWEEVIHRSSIDWFWLYCIPFYYLSFLLRSFSCQYTCIALHSTRRPFALQVVIVLLEYKRRGTICWNFGLSKRCTALPVSYAFFMCHVFYTFSFHFLFQFALWFLLKDLVLLLFNWIARSLRMTIRVLFNLSIGDNGYRFYALILGYMHVRVNEGRAL